MEKKENTKRDRKALLEKHLKEEATQFDVRDYVASPQNLWTKDVVIYKGTEREHKRKLVYGKIPLKKTLNLKGDKQQQGLQMLFLMLGKADSKLKIEDIENMDSEVATTILKAIYPGELPLQNKLKDSNGGSATTQKPK